MTIATTRGLLKSVGALLLVIVLSTPPITGHAGAAYQRSGPIAATALRTTNWWLFTFMTAGLDYSYGAILTRSSGHVSGTFNIIRGTVGTTCQRGTVAGTATPRTANFTVIFTTGCTLVTNFSGQLGATSGAGNYYNGPGGSGSWSAQLGG